MNKWEKPIALEYFEYSKQEKEKFFQKNAKENYGYYNGLGHWTSDEIRKLTSEDRPVTVLNYIFKAINAMSGNEIINRNDIYAFPAENSDVQMANIINFGLKYIKQKSNLGWRFSQANLDGFITGQGFIKNMIFVDKDGSIGITAKNRNPLLIYFDPDSIEYDLSDAQHIHEVIYITKKELVSKYPHLKREIEDFYGAKNLENHELYVNEKGNLCTVVYTEYKKHEREEYWIVGNKVIRYDKVRKVWKDNFGKTYRKNPTTGKRGFIRIAPKVYGVWHFGDVELEPEVKNPFGCGEEDFSYTMFAPYFVGGKAISPIDQVKSIQDIINKSYSQGLDILNRQPKVGGFYEKGAIEDPDDLEEISTTGKWLEVKDIDKIKEIRPPLFPDANMAMLKSSIDLIKEILGLPEIFLGEAPGRVESGLGLQILKRQSGLPFEQPSDNLRYSQILVGKKFINQMKEFWSMGKLMRISGEDGNFKDVKINDTNIQIVDVDKYTGEPISEPQTLENKLAEYDYDITIDVNSPSVSQRLVNQMMAIQLFNQLPDPRFIPLLIDMLDFPDKDKWKAAIQQIQQQPMAGGGGNTPVTPDSIANLLKATGGGDGIA